jgi:catecholate siderophore receptor
MSDQTTLDVSVEAIDYDRSIDRGIPNIGGKPVTAYDDIVFGDPDLNKSEFESLAFRALLQHSFSDTLKGIFTASYTDYDKLYQNFYAKKYFDQGTEDLADDTVDLDGYVDTTKRQNLVLSGNLVAELEAGDIKHTLLYGAEYMDSQSDNDRLIPAGTLNFKIADRNVAGTGFNAGGLQAPASKLNQYKDDTATDITVFSLYAQDEIELTDQLTVLLGARFDSFDINVTTYDAAGAGDGGESQKDEEFTPRAGLVYKPDENISLYASYSQTFLPQSGDQFDKLGTKGLDPDEFTNLEAGVKWDFADSQSVTFAIFEIEQTLAESDNSGPYTVDDEIEGFEAQYLGRITDQWTVSAGYTYLTGETSKGNRPAELPKSSFSIWNSYQLTEKLGLGLGAVHKAESTPKGFPSKATGTVPSYTRVDAAAYYQLSENLRLQLNVENLLDEEYYPHAYGTHQFTVGAPLNATVSIKGTF